jgi:hypothetical protein
MKKFRLPKLPFSRRSRGGASPSSRGGRGPETGVALADGARGSTFLHEGLRDAVERWPQTFGSDVIPSDPKAFRQGMVDALAAFEARRLASPERAAIATHLADRAQAGLVFRDDAGARALGAHLAETKPGVSLQQAAGGRGPVPNDWFQVPFQGMLYRNERLAGLVDRLHRAHDLSDSAHAALTTAVAGGANAHALAGRRFAVLGAGAELAPTAMLLEAGADVLWIDRAEPEKWLLQRFGARQPAGRLFVPAGGACLLTSPLRVAAAIEAFAAGEGLDGTAAPVHLGLFAYAPGRGRELRLTGVMDAIVRALPPAIVASVAMYISPTTPGEVVGSDIEAAQRRRREAPLWQRVLLKTGALSGPGHVEYGGRAVARGVVPLQGPTYQAAQYLTKMMSAEAVATRGLGGDEEAVKVPVSANVAGITATKSLEHPLFQAAFIGAPKFNIHIFEPATTRALSALLMLHDILGEGSREQELDALNRRQIHGGVYSHPWFFDQAIRAGAVIGLSRRPDLLLKLRG